MASIMVRIDEFDDNVDLIRHQIFNMIRQYNVQFRDEFGEMIVCMDAKSNWRRDAFPHYKASRRKNRKESIHDWDNIFRVMDEVREEIKQKSPFKCIQIEKCEADDVIGTIVEKNMTSNPILIVSPDKDFIQLQRYPNVKQYSNLQKKWVEPDVSALVDLEIKVLKGDTGDGVPNVMSDDDVLITEGVRQGVLSKKNIEKLMADPEALGTTVARRIIRNRNLIDLTRTPEELKNNIIEEFNKPANGSITSLMGVFTRHKMKMLMESLQDFEVRS